MKFWKKWGVAGLIICAVYFGFLGILSIKYPIVISGNEIWIEFLAFLFVFFGSLGYWKWLKMLKKFKWNESTQKWDQVHEDIR